MSVVCYNLSMTRVQQLLEEAAQLPEDQRLTLAHRLLQSGEPAATEEVDRAWDTEIRKRIARYDRGEARTRSAADVFSDLGHRLKP
jgi:hypothetical protein